MRIDRCNGCGEYIDIASDHAPGCTRNATNQVIPAEAVEAAAKAFYATEAQPMYDESKEQFTGARPWEWLTERSWEAYREKARQALEAAAPHMLAAAWEEGYMFSYDQERGGNGALPIPVPEHLAEDLAHWNPHRTPDAV